MLYVRTGTVPYVPRQIPYGGSCNQTIDRLLLEDFLVESLSPRFQGGNHYESSLGDCLMALNSGGSSTKTKL